MARFGKMAPSKSQHHQVFARTPTPNPKATQHTLAVLGHGWPCSQKHFTCGHPEKCSKASDLSLFVSNPLSFYCIICHMISLFHIISAFPTNHCKLGHNALAVVSNLQLHAKNAKSLKNLNSIFCAEMQYIHSPSMATLPRLWISDQKS